MRIYWRLIKLLMPFRLWVAAAVLLGFATVGSSVGLMAFSAYLISKAALTTDPSQLSVAIAGVRFFALSRALFRYAERVITHTATFRILAYLRTWFYNAIEPLAPARLHHYRSGDLLSRIMADIETLEQFFIRVIVPPLSAVLVIILSTVLLGSFHPSLGFALLIFLLLTGLVLPIISQTLSRQSAAQLITVRSELNATLLDGVQGLADLIAFEQSYAYQERTNNLGKKLDHIHGKIAMIRGFSGGLAALFTSLAGITILWMAVPLVNGNQIDGIFLALLPLAAIASFEAVQPLSQSLQLLESSKTSANRLFELIDASPPIIEPSQSSPQNITPSISFNRVSFRYNQNEPDVLREVTFSLEAGKHLAISGPSGSGKSTIVNLLLRFWEYNQGQIKLGENDLQDFKASDVRRLITVIAQHTYIFNSTIRDNLYLADPDASDEQLMNACKIAQLDQYIADLPLGLDTPTGENGLQMSGGERQRLAVARAVLKNSPILILDEATANLDAETEQHLWADLEEIMNGRTTIIISHRTAVIPPVDQIIHLSNGIGV